MSIDTPLQLQAQINVIFNKQTQTAGGSATSSDSSSPSALLLRRQTTKWLQAAKSTPKKVIERSQSQVQTVTNCKFGLSTMILLYWSLISAY